MRNPRVALGSMAIPSENLSSMLSIASVGAIADAPVERHDWGRIGWLSSAAICEDSGQTLGYVEIDAGQTNYRHRHPNCEEILLLLAGHLEHWVGDAVVAMEPGVSLRIPAGVVHWATNPGSSPAKMIVAYPTGFRDIELVPAEVVSPDLPT